MPLYHSPQPPLTYESTWDASTNTPTLSDATGVTNQFYIVDVAGSQDLGSGSRTYAVGDWVVFEGNIWQKIGSSASVAPANPTAQVGLSAINGSAPTFMRSDAAPALSQAIVPTWTGVHTFNAETTFGATVHMGEEKIVNAGDATNPRDVVNLQTMQAAIPVAANPSATIGLTAANGSAGTFMRSDAAPALDQSIAPTWTGQHTWTEPLLVNSGGVQTSWTPGGSVLQIGTVTSHNLNIATNNVTRMTVAANGDVQMAAGYTPANPRSIVTKEYSDAQDALKVNTADKASEAEAEAGTDDTKWMTPLKTAQAINALAHGGDDTTVYVLSADAVFSDTNLTGVPEFSQIVLANNLNQVRLIEGEFYISGAHEAGIKFKFQNSIGDGTTVSYNGSYITPEGITGDDPMQVADYEGGVGQDGVRYDPTDTIRKVTLSLYVTSQAFGGSYGSLLFGAALQNMADPVTIHAGSKVTVRLVSSVAP